MNSNSKENFCGACITVPLAMAGAGVGAIGANQKGQHKKRKKYILITGISISLIFTIISVYILFIKKCDTCIL
jgi:uncharacterized membrane protein YsdA (DUF1294 family)